MSPVPIPSGLLLPVLCSKKIWVNATAVIVRGMTKCKAKKRFNVALLTENPPHNHWTTASPYGKALNRLVITVAPQKLICPHGNT